MTRQLAQVFTDDGFTMVELMIVVVIIGVLITIAIPIFFSSRSNAEKKTCFANQRTLDGAAQTWLATNPGKVAADLQGVVNKTHPLVEDDHIANAPRCPAAPAPAQQGNPTPAEGAYSFDASANVLPCSFGLLGPHGSYE